MDEHVLFRRAEALIPELVALLQGAGSLQEREELAHACIDEKWLHGASGDAEKYLGCLLKAYIHHIRCEEKLPEKLEEDLRGFIRGDYDVRGVQIQKDNRLLSLDEARMRSEGHQAQLALDRIAGRSIADAETAPPSRPIVGLRQANHLAMWKICEQALTKQFGDADLGRRLAASTARLFVTRMEQGTEEEKRAVIVSGQEVLVKSLSRTKFNPFAQARILEFAAMSANLTHSRFPLIKLFGKYMDYSPSGDYTIATHAERYISLQNPGEFFSSVAQWKEEEKYDYVIAGNVFCDGAVYHRATHRNSGHTLYNDLLPHLANVLKDQGRLIVSNTASDGLNITDRDPTMRRFGLIPHDARIPLFEGRSHSGISVLRRDYALRPPVPYDDGAELDDVEGMPMTRLISKKGKGWDIDL